jgi:hypothetical protein
MKCKLNILLCFIFLYAYNSAHAQITFPKNVDLKDVVAQLFETKYNPVDSTFIWIPNVSESVQFTWEHKKDTLITKIDTVFNYKNFYDNKKVILTYTNTFNNSCHACQPSLGLIGLSLDEEKNEYKLEYVQKFVTKSGTWGEPPSKREIIQLSDIENALIITEEYSGSGVEAKSSSIFIDGNKIFSFITSFSDAGAREFENQRTRYKQYISFDKKRKLIKIVKKGKEPNQKGKIVPVDSVSYYNFEDGFLNKKSTTDLLIKK